MLEFVVFILIHQDWLANELLGVCLFASHMPQQQGYRHTLLLYVYVKSWALEPESLCCCQAHHWPQGQPDTCLPFSRWQHLCHYRLRWETSVFPHSPWSQGLQQSQSRWIWRNMVVLHELHAHTSGCCLELWPVDSGKAVLSIPALSRKNKNPVCGRCL